MTLKKDKSVPLTCDFGYVNKYTVPDGFLMQNIDEVKLKVGKSNFISVFDAKSGYWQVKVREEDQWLTAFSTHNSLYEWTKVPFGMKNGGKCEFGKNSVKYVGHIIGSGRNEPDPERIQAVVEMQLPASKKQTNTPSLTHV